MFNLNNKKRSIHYWLEEQKRGQRIMLVITLIATTSLIWYNNINEYNQLMEAKQNTFTIYEQIIERKSNPSVLEQGVKDTPEKDGSEDVASRESNPQLNTGDEIKDRIREIAQQENFANADLLVNIAFCESSLNPQATNDHSSATGLFQILDMHGLTVAERMNVDVSTRWAINHINTGHLSAWDSSRGCWS